MAYATQQDIIDRYGEDALAAVADREVDGEIDTDAVTAALDDAGAEIDSYLGVKYPLPLETTPAPVERACIDIVIYNLAGNRATEDMEKRYDRALSWLKDISAGRASLGGHTVDTAPSQASFSVSDRVTGRDRMKGGF